MGAYAITLTEGDSAAKADFTLMYPNSTAWSVAAKRGTPVLQSDVSKIYLYAKALESDAVAWLQLTTDSALQIAWINGPGATDGKIRAYFGAGTAGHAGDGQIYELRVKFTDNTYLTWVKDTINVLQSLIDQAA
jgi:hypothetical protein